jgi:hypothetical protein
MLNRIYGNSIEEIHGDEYKYITRSFIIYALRHTKYQIRGNEIHMGGGGE